MLLIFLVLLVGAVLAFVFRDKFRQRFTSLLKDNLIITYQDDPDKQSTIDWLQEQVPKLYQINDILYARNIFYDFLVLFQIVII